MLELGSYDGKWTQYFLKAKKIICVDVFELSFEYLKKNLDSQKLEFYLTQGNELKGIKSESIDLIFTIDTLTRVEKEYVKQYFEEFNRVLKPGKTALIALSCISKEMSRNAGLTPFTLNEINRMCKKNFNQYILHSNIINHGIFIEAIK